MISFIRLIRLDFTFSHHTNKFKQRQAIGRHYKEMFFKSVILGLLIIGNSSFGKFLIHPFCQSTLTEHIYSFKHHQKRHQWLSKWWTWFIWRRFHWKWRNTWRPKKWRHPRWWGIDWSMFGNSQWSSKHGKWTN